MLVKAVLETPSPNEKHARVYGSRMESVRIVYRAVFLNLVEEQHCLPGEWFSTRRRTESMEDCGSRTVLYSGRRYPVLLGLMTW